MARHGPRATTTTAAERAANWWTTLRQALRRAPSRGTATGPAVPLRLGYEPRATSTPRASAPAAPITAAPPAIDGLLVALDRLLSLHPQTRQVMRQLAFVETVLRRSGERMLAELPPHVLIRAGQQLDTLTEGRLSPDLAQFSARLSSYLALHTKLAPSGAAPRSSGWARPASLLEVGSDGDALFHAGARPRRDLALPDMPRIARAGDFQPTRPMED